jgi:hypothetical protein
MATQASVPLDLAMVEGLVHPPRTLYHLTPPLLQLILKTTKTMKKAEKRVKTMSEAS